WATTRSRARTTSSASSPPRTKLDSASAIAKRPAPPPRMTRSGTVTGSPDRERPARTHECRGCRRAVQAVVSPEAARRLLRGEREAHLLDARLEVRQALALHHRVE